MSAFQASVALVAGLLTGCSVMIHRFEGEDQMAATILARTRDGLEAIEAVPLDVAPATDPGGNGMRRLAFGSLLAGRRDHTRFHAVIERGEIIAPCPMR